MPDVRIKQERDKAVAHELSVAYHAAVPEDEQERSNALLAHACSCDDAPCRDAQFRGLCAHMKRFLRAACWASHCERWRSYPIAAAVTELFAYHALHCHALQCNVPMCRQLRGQVLL
ncbi:PHD and RING finger domain-containing protein 1 [Phytophthora pseudosyringae]|uniref:PHD and RING finger domain-containing protein 1 n=1 Tax=Phytophthora pseudosyringae TaxID=221518 RepID=A0A8T1WK75_9STRA|nr:PHD and RING finger domain-containing protein 1 [Phytophthora pseudosyringae]